MVVLHSGNTGPNSELTKMLAIWRGRMMLKRMVDSPDYRKLRYALLSSVLKCETLDPSKNDSAITQFIPPSLNKNAKTDYESFKKDIDSQIQKEHRAVLETVGRNNPFSNDKANSRSGIKFGSRYRVVGSLSDRLDMQVKQIAYLWRMIGLNPLEMNTSEHQKFNFNDGRSGIGPFFKSFMDYNAKCDPDLAKYNSELTYDLYAGVTPKHQIDDDGISPDEAKWRAAKIQSLCNEIAEKGRVETQLQKPTNCHPGSGHEQISPEIPGR